ncbi:hypothetical protein RF55_10962 [Lasius niger]|uniref:Uncharacterized protein n=1 Tax=Lasius niger TaxID=67767 RepID=A0A0J7KGN6_LASNI|nr:hypothetical protein RF55_10962 [Lasius niger]
MSRKTSPVASKITRSQFVGFFFWGYLENAVYENAPTRLDLMDRIRMDRIRRACETITLKVLRSVSENFKRRL